MSESALRPVKAQGSCFQYRRSNLKLTFLHLLSQLWVSWLSFAGAHRTEAQVVCEVTTRWLGEQQPLCGAEKITFDWQV